MTVSGRLRALPDVAATEAFAAELAPRLPKPFVIYLRGDLGAGKTTFARALLRAFGFIGRVKSPTYGLLESYPAGGRTVLHLDLYRVESPADLEYLAIADQFGDDGLLLVEWPERGTGWLPPADLELQFDYAGEGRQVRITSLSAAAQSLPG